jgi:hypothetical protein
MRKMFFIIGALLFLLSQNTGCDYSQRSAFEADELPVSSEKQQSTSLDNTLLPQIRVNDEIYYFVGNLDSRISFDEDSYTGSIISTISTLETPTINGQANFGVEGAPYVIQFGTVSLLWNDKWAYFLTNADIQRNEALINAPKTAPMLYATVLAGDSSQTVEARQLTTSWRVMNDQINGSGYNSDSSGPLSIPPERMKVSTLFIDTEYCIIELKFTDDYLPESIFIQRWGASSVENNQDYAGEYFNGEPVPVDGLTFQINDDGDDFIYEVHATWLPGNSNYAFMICVATQD